MMLTLVARSQNPQAGPDRASVLPKGDLSLITLGKPAFEGDVQALRWAVEIRDEQGEFGEWEFNPGVL